MGLEPRPRASFPLKFAPNPSVLYSFSPARLELSHKINLNLIFWRRGTVINYHPVCGEDTMYSADQDRKSIWDFPSQLFIMV